MRKGTYKSPYPHTLLADALWLLMGCQGWNANQLADMVGENRGTLSHMLHARRACKDDLFRRLCMALLPGRNSTPLVEAFYGDCAAVLAIPHTLVLMEPMLARRRARAIQAGVDIGALCCGYGPKTIDDDVTNMEQLGRWPIACRWAGYAVVVARQRGNTYAEMKARLRHARLLLASSQFAECQATLDGVLAHPAVPAGDLATAFKAKVNGERALLRAQGEIYRGWLNFEMGRYGQAQSVLEDAVTALLALAGERGCFPERQAPELPTLAAIAARGELAHLLDLALHVRAKVMAEQAMYVGGGKDAGSMAKAGRALAKSIAVSAYLRQDGSLGHGLLWLARLMANAALDGWGTRADDGPWLLTADVQSTIEAARHPTTNAMCDLLADPSVKTAKRILSLVGSGHFKFASGSPVQRGYFRRAKGAILALQASAPEEFQSAYYVLADAAKAMSAAPLEGQPDLRGLGPLYFEIYRLYSADTYRMWHNHYGNAGQDRAPCPLDWLVASVAAHPTPFAIAALGEAAVRERTIWSELIANSRERVLSLREPFDTLGNAAVALWADESQRRLEQNVDGALRTVAAMP